VNRKLDMAMLFLLNKYKPRKVIIYNKGKPELLKIYYEMLLSYLNEQLELQIRFI